MPAVYQIMGDALLKTKRPIVYSLCQYGRLDVWKWGADVGGNLWRTTGDIRDAWDSMTRIGFSQNDLAPWARPGHWNDPDMLEIGNGAMSETEYKTHMSLWAVLAAPLLAGNDLRSMSPEILAILTNREVIAVNQDKLGQQGKQAWKSGDQEVWTRSLSGGDIVVTFFNRATESATIKIKWADLKLTGKWKARDLWSHQNMQLTEPDYSVTIPGHGVLMLRLSR
jgi:alpha-galactosidase